RKLFERVKELEHKLEMAEANLRTVLAAARGRGATAAPSDNEMEALLKILKTPGSEEAGGEPLPDLTEALTATVPEPGGVPAVPRPAGEVAGAGLPEDSPDPAPAEAAGVSSIE